MVAMVDVDDTLAPTQSALLGFINRRALRPYRFSELDERFREGHDKAYDQLVKRFLARPELVGRLKPYGFARNAVESLYRAGFAVHIVSSRKEQLHGTTEYWLEEHGFEPFIEAYHRRPAIISGAEFKGEVAGKIAATVAFDDTLGVARRLSDQNVYVYLIDKPWNSCQELPPNIRRIDDVSSGVEHLLGSVRASRNL